MKILVIEDEPLAAEKLIGYIERYFDDAEVLAVLSRVDEVIGFFEQPQGIAAPELIFSDVELLDGQVFTAMQALDLPCPVIFTTSYEQYWMQAFANQGIEYLLKPFSFKRFSEAMANFEQLKLSLAARAATKTGHYKSRLLLKKAQGMQVLALADVACFRTSGGVVMACDTSGEHHMLTSGSINELQTQLDPEVFFRISRSDMVNINFIERFENYGKDTLAVYLSCLDEPLITSKTRSAEFRRWLDS